MLFQDKLVVVLMCLVLLFFILNRELRRNGVFRQMEMYSGQQSDRGPAADNGKEFLEGNWGAVAMHQKMGCSSGTYGFQDYSMEFEEKPGLCRSSTG
jgi:hypothetical protein